MMANTELKRFNLVVDVMLEGGYTPSVLTDFLIKGLDNVRTAAARKGIFQEDLNPNPLSIQLKILESLSSLHQDQPKQSGRPGKRSRRKAETPPTAVPVSIPQAPQLEVVAQLGKKKQEIAETPPAEISMALAPPAAESMPQGKKRKELASEADLESEEEQGNLDGLTDEFASRFNLGHESKGSEEEQSNLERLTDEFASRFNLGHESKGPSPKRLKRNVSGREARTNRPQETISIEELKNANDPPPPPSPPSPQPQPQPQQQQQQRRRRGETPAQSRIREAALAKASARGEVIR